MKMVMAIIRRERLERVLRALKKEKAPGITISEVKGYGKEVHLYSDDIYGRIKIEIIADGKDADRYKQVILKEACCGLEGDGLTAVYPLDDVVFFS